MKKVLTIVCCFILCLSLAACSGGGTDKPDEAMEKYIASLQGELDQMTATLKDSGMDLKVTGRGNSLVYTYQYTIDIGDTSLVKASLEQSMETLSSTYEAILTELKKELSSAESVIIEYLDKDGNMIFSKEFK